MTHYAETPIPPADAESGGRYRIRFETRGEGGALYGPKRVRLLLAENGRIVREAWSDADGAGLFIDLAYRYRGYTVLTCANRRANGDLDYPDIADFVTPEPMP